MTNLHEDDARDIIDPKQAEEALRESETRFRSLFRDSAIGMAVVAPNCDLLQVNRAFCEFFGYSEQEMLHKTIESLTHPDDWRRSELALHRALETGPCVMRFEKRYLHKSGEVLWGEVNFSLVCDADGKPDYFVTQLLDITQRKRAEEALQSAHDQLERLVEQRTHDLREANDQLSWEVQRRRQTEQELQSIFDGMLDGLLIVDVESLRYVRANASVCRLLGYSEAELLSMSVADIHVPEDAIIVTARLRARARGEIFGGRDATVVRKDGTKLSVEIVANRLNYGGRVCVAGFFRDVTERRRAEEALAESEAKYRNLVEATNTGYLVLDDTGGVLDANDEYVRISGHHALSEIAGRTVMEWTAPYDADRNAKEVETCLREGTVRQLEVDYVGPSGKVIPVEINANCIETTQGRRILSLCRDISERRRAQAALEREQRTLEHMLQASDHERQLIAYDIHDGLAQQLAGAIMQFQIFGHRKDAQPDEAAKAFDAGVTMLRQSHFEARRLISGVRPPILDESGVVAAIAHLANDQSLEMGPKVEFQSKVKFNRLVPVLENAIYRIVQEGLTNACKHSQSQRVQIRLLQRNDRLQIQIRDWGIGFDPKARCDNRFGLEGIRERARLLGGLCRIQSNPRKGTSIMVELPLLQRDR